MDFVRIIAGVRNNGVSARRELIVVLFLVDSFEKNGVKVKRSKVKVFDLFWVFICWADNLYKKSSD